MIFQPAMLVSGGVQFLDVAESLQMVGKKVSYNLLIHGVYCGGINATDPITFDPSTSFPGHPSRGHKKE